MNIRFLNLAKNEMIPAGPRPLIMFLKDWVIRWTVVEDGYYLCNAKANIPINQTFFLNCQQKWETWSDTCRKSETLLWPGAQGFATMAHISLTLCSGGERATPLTLNEVCFKGILKRIIFFLISFFVFNLKCWDPSPLTRNRTVMEVRSLSHWIDREVP